MLQDMRNIEIVCIVSCTERVSMHVLQHMQLPINISIALLPAIPPWYKLERACTIATLLLSFGTSRKLLSLKP